MTRTSKKLVQGALCLVALVACLVAAPAQAQISIQVGPPSWYVATTSPVYYEGHASYWYGNQWHYRQGRTWHTYREEPRYLHDHRSQHGSNRHSYGHDDGNGHGNMHGNGH